jgi:hypothetical protein
VDEITAADLPPPPDPDEIIEKELDAEVYEEEARRAADDLDVDDEESLAELMQEPPEGPLSIISDQDIPGEPG